jgi:hypothetical protein
MLWSCLWFDPIPFFIEEMGVSSIFLSPIGDYGWYASVSCIGLFFFAMLTSLCRASTHSRFISSELNG